jgi:hypothetical protein
MRKEMIAARHGIFYDQWFTATDVSWYLIEAIQISFDHHSFSYISRKHVLVG